MIDITQDAIDKILDHFNDGEVTPIRIYMSEGG